MYPISLITVCCGCIDKRSGITQFQLETCCSLIAVTWVHIAYELVDTQHRVFDSHIGQWQVTSVAHLDQVVDGVTNLCWS